MPKKIRWAAVSEMTKKINIKKHIAKNSNVTCAERFFKNQITTEYRNGWKNQLFKRDPDINDKMIDNHTEGMITTYEFEDGSALSVFNNQTGQQIDILAQGGNVN